MSEMSLNKCWMNHLKTIRNGEVVEGTVIDVKDDQIILNIGYKSRWYSYQKTKYSNILPSIFTPLHSQVTKMEVKVLKVNDGEGQVLLTYKRLAAEKRQQEDSRKHSRIMKY